MNTCSKAQVPDPNRTPFNDSAHCTPSPAERGVGSTEAPSCFPSKGYPACTALALCDNVTINPMHLSNAQLSWATDEGKIASHWYQLCSTLNLLHIAATSPYMFIPGCSFMPGTCRINVNFLYPSPHSPDH